MFFEDLYKNMIDYYDFKVVLHKSSHTACKGLFQTRSKDPGEFYRRDPYREGYPIY